jgi:hypothetical protein
MWTAFVQMPNAKTAEGPAKIRQQYQASADGYRNPATYMTDVTGAVASEKLHLAINQKIAANDYHVFGAMGVVRVLGSAAILAAKSESFSNCVQRSKSILVNPTRSVNEPLNVPFLLN